ncbi:hypothetical protein ASD82_00045 [Rhodanobacter sp. Root179]|nr:hypothetical protein ASD82_00045 [Rhodanobacter sp. Root179]
MVVDEVVRDRVDFGMLRSQFGVESVDGGMRLDLACLVLAQACIEQAGLLVREAIMRIPHTQIEAHRPARMLGPALGAYATDVQRWPVARQADTSQGSAGICRAK